MSKLSVGVTFTWMASNKGMKKHGYGLIAAM